MNNLQIKSTIDERRTARISQVRRHLKSGNFLKTFTAMHPTKTMNNLQIKSTIDERRTARVSQVRRHLKSVNFLKNFTATHLQKLRCVAFRFLVCLRRF